jgi:hypothetical protein
MKTSSDERNPVELLAAEFLERKRRGEHPTLGEYLERHPELAHEIQDLFPALLMMEDLGQSPGVTTGSLTADNGAALGIKLQRWVTTGSSVRSAEAGWGWCTRPSKNPWGGGWL